MDKIYKIQNQARNNAKSVQTYMTDLQNWELEMKRKEAALNGQFEQDLPPVRSKLKKEKPVHGKKKAQKRISASDYKAWERFDADKACEDVDMAEVGPISLDSKKSQEAKQEKLREEAQYEKERGNAFVKLSKWDDAISCYNRAIELVNDDAIYYANRGLCYLKKDCLHQAESDCTEALNLDPTYVKALQRRATARERLGSLRAASQDLIEVLNLEPHNSAAKKQLDGIKARMGTKGAKSKSSPMSTPTNEIKPIVKARGGRGKVVASSTSEPRVEVKKPSPLDLWRDGVGERITVIKPVKKPPHLRSKRQLKSIPIREIQLGGRVTPEKPPTRLKIVEIDSSRTQSNRVTEGTVKPELMSSEMSKGQGDGDIPSAEWMKLGNEISNKGGQRKYLTPPLTSVQFMAEWKYLKGRDSARSAYLSNIDPEGIPKIFDNALESEVLSDVIRLLHDDVDSFAGRSVTAYLQALCRVKRFSALAMFLSTTDKQYLTELLIHCKAVERCSDEDIADLKKKFEL